MGWLRSTNDDSRLALRFACAGAFAMTGMQLVGRVFPFSFYSEGSAPILLGAIWMGAILSVVASMLLFRDSKLAVPIGLVVLAGEATVNVWAAIRAMAKPFVDGDILFWNTAIVLLPTLVLAVCLIYLGMKHGNGIERR